MGMNEQHDMTRLGARARSAGRPHGRRHLEADTAHIDEQRAVGLLVRELSGEPSNHVLPGEQCPVESPMSTGKCDLVYSVGHASSRGVPGRLLCQLLTAILLAVAFGGCGGSSSETPPPLPPAPGAGASAAASADRESRKPEVRREPRTPSIPGSPAGPARSTWGS